MLAVACASGEVVDVPEHFPPMPVPEDNALTFERVELGRRLFFDARLSRTEEVSCAVGARNAPALFNLAWNTSFFWDGSAPTLEHQAMGPILNPLEMDMRMEEVVSRLSADGSYVRQFEDAYGGRPSAGAVALLLRAGGVLPLPRGLQPDQQRVPQQRDPAGRPGPCCSKRMPVPDLRFRRAARAR